MESMKLIDENQYFVESKKAIQIVLEKESLLEKKLKIDDELQLVKDHKKKTNSPEEFEELVKLQKELETKIRFNQFTVPAVPEEQREKIKKNATVEQLEVDNKLNELKAQLKEQIESLENNFLPLITNIKKLENMKKIPNQIDAILDTEIGEGAVFPVRSLIQIFNVSSDEAQAATTIKNAKKVIEALKKIEVPVETKGLLAFLKRGKK